MSGYECVLLIDRSALRLRKLRPPPKKKKKLCLKVNPYTQGTFAEISTVIDKRFVNKIGDKITILRKYDMLT